MKLEIKRKETAILSQGKLFFKGKKYTTENIHHNLLVDINAIGSILTIDTVMFIGRQFLFSNFYTKPDLFTDKNGIQFSSVEQYY